MISTGRSGAAWQRRRGRRGSGGGEGGVYATGDGFEPLLHETDGRWYV